MNELEAKVNKEFAEDRKNMVEDEGETVDEAEVPESAKLQVGKGEIIDKDTTNSDATKDSGKDYDVTTDTKETEKAIASKPGSENVDAKLDNADKINTTADTNGEIVPNTDGDGDDLRLDDPTTPGEGNGGQDEGDPKDADDDTEDPPTQPDDGLVLDDPKTDTRKESTKQNEQAMQVMDSSPDMPQSAPLPLDATIQNSYPPMLPTRPLTEDPSTLPIGCVVFVTIILLIFIFKPKNKYHKINHQDSNKSI